MKIVDPALVRQFAITPGAIALLFPSRVPSYLQSGTDKSLISGSKIQSTQEGSREEVCVVNLRLRSRQGITEGSECVALCVVKLFHQVIACAQRHFQTSCVPERFESIQQGIRNKDCANQVGRAARN